ncbi:hypothetical protein SAMN00808754_1523 [Thermanaeromonas toyohensis ToBE]|uniref:Flp pilus-assembly TadE/G-like n=1 Tax=Thermanaeromonas toyohensis ToBE TaxID=698762 RepID=A0A1W1VT38_9FIRM|nr:hypothetical protein [Thermanaeromonas toyohensis]SMB96518.1 hypothetical protein SAMN00808754_1523 [Thermanaeromonas toyohensis ToBE]
MRGRILKDNRGFAVLMVFLLLVPMLLLAMEGMVNLNTAVTVSDVDLQEAVAFAVKAAAMQVTPASQASGHPRINAERAHAAFREILAKNLGFDPNTMVPLPGLSYASVRYTLVVYNGYDDYVFENAPGAKAFRFDGAVGTEYGFPYSGFPATFTVTPADILWGSAGGRMVTLPSPGAVAVVEAEAKKILGVGTLRTVRWAAARIVCVEGTCSVR